MGLVVCFVGGNHCVQRDKPVGAQEEFVGRQGLG